MDYQKHYDLLCERAKNRDLEEYTENHHIVPRCLGGTDNEENLVRLTPEEHYVAHQLLTKIYPNHKGLLWAAVQMTGHNSKGRKNNKLYGWLRRKYISLAKQRIGEENGSYGRHWYHNPETEEVIKCLPEEVPEGFIKGRSITELRNCEGCGKKFRVERWKKNKFCSEKCISRTNPEKTEYYAKLARYYWNQFQNSNQKSIMEFVKESDYPRSHVTLTRLWKKHIPEYNEKVEHGKSLKESLKTNGE